MAMLTQMQVEDIKAAHPEACGVIESNIAACWDSKEQYEQPFYAAWENAFCHPSITSLDNSEYVCVDMYFYHFWSTYTGEPLR